MEGSEKGWGILTIFCMGGFTFAMLLRMVAAVRRSGTGPLRRCGSGGGAASASSCAARRFSAISPAMTANTGAVGGF